MSFLRKNVWALSLIAGNAGDGFENNSTYSMFPVVITLTKAGYDNIDKVSSYGSIRLCSIWFISCTGCWVRIMTWFLYSILI